MTNALSFVVIVRSDLMSTSTGLYLCTLAWADCFSLASLASSSWSMPTFGQEFHLFRLCNVKQFFISFSTSLSAMCIVCVTSDRFIAVWFPFKAKQLTTRRKAAVVLTLLIIAMAAIYIPAFLAVSHDCVVNENLRGYLYGDMFTLINIFYSYGPIACLLCLNLAISGRLAFTPSMLVKTQSSCSGNQSSQTSQAIATVLTVSFAFIICSVPINVLFSLFSAKRTVSEDPFTLEAVFTFARCLNFANHSINFYLYVLTSGSFRRNLVSLFCQKCRQTDRNVAASSATAVSEMSM